MTDILKSGDPHTQPSFTAANRTRRAFWNLICAVFFRFSPRPMHSWRSFLLKCFGAKLGRGCHVYPTARIWAPWNLEMEDHACLGDDVDCYSMAKIFLGKKAIVSQGVFLCTGTHDHEDPRFRLYAEPIRIGADAWVCAQSFVGPGVHVGQGAVIGARSVVTKDVPEWTVYAGNPAKFLKPRKIKSK